MCLDRSRSSCKSCGWRRRKNVQLQLPGHPSVAAPSSVPYPHPPVRSARSRQKASPLFPKAQYSTVETSDIARFWVDQRIYCVCSARNSLNCRTSSRSATLDGRNFHPPRMPGPTNNHPRRWRSDLSLTGHRRCRAKQMAALTRSHKRRRQPLPLGPTAPVGKPPPGSAGDPSWNVQGTPPRDVLS